MRKNLVKRLSVNLSWTHSDTAHHTVCEDVCDIEWDLLSAPRCMNMTRPLC